MANSRKQTSAPTELWTTALPSEVRRRLCPAASDFTDVLGLRPSQRHSRKGFGGQVFRKVIDFPHIRRQSRKTPKFNWGTQTNLHNVVVAICLILMLFAFSSSAQTQNAETSSPCLFDNKRLSFKGKPIEQARCLLRPAKMYGALEPELKQLPEPLEKIIGKKTKIDKKKLREYLQKQNIEEEDLGGSIDSKLSTAKLPNGKKAYALYFLIHDVSTPNYEDKPFPEDINKASWAVNDLEKRWKNTKVAHLFINRLGDSITTVDFGSTLPEKNFGTKFARDFLKADAKGLQIHVELIQPRRSDPNGVKGNDGIAPIPGFTQAQYDRLALVYLAASVRRGRWLIPSFHAAMDAGIPNAHDDPQNFDLEQWAKSIDILIKSLR